MKIYKVEAYGDTLYVQGVSKDEAYDRLTEFTGPIPRGILTWSEIEELPVGEDLIA